MTTLSVLDQSPIRAGGTPAQALAETVQLAQACDRWGYTRYWLAEHHSSEGLAGTAPEVLIARVAAATRDMRVGSGGVMLSHYSALKVAESFRVLEALYPGRIDLGIGRAPGSDYRTMVALQAGPGAARHRAVPGPGARRAGLPRRRAAGGPSVRGHSRAAARADHARSVAPRLERRQRRHRRLFRHAPSPSRISSPTRAARR